MSLFPYSLQKSISQASVILLLVLLVSLTSCKKFLDVKPPRALVQREKVFEDDISATAAMAAVYAQMKALSSFASGGPQSVAVLAALSADELIHAPATDPNLIQFEQNNIISTNSSLKSLWASSYLSIYRSNAVIEGLVNPTGITMATSAQLTGEALFVRAFVHFYLTNLFGEVPIVTSTNYETNAKISRSPINSIYTQIVNDLEKAKTLLSENYVTDGRVRPNQAACRALLARVYIFLERWEDALVEATAIIDNPLYDLPLLDDSFLQSSTEAIWQYHVIPNNSLTTVEGNTLVIEATRHIKFQLSQDFLNSFEPGDQRQVKWVGLYSNAAGTYQFPYKYKNRTGQGNEKSIIFRLAEQYLIRAEAYAHLGNIPAALADLDELRSRASLPLLSNIHPDISISELHEAIMHERRVELFTEWGHRWLDLKRTNTANEILDPIKADWSETDIYFPIPQSEFLNNPNL